MRIAARPLPRRLLLGPGPSNVAPAVLEAMATPLVGHLDPAFLRVLDEVQQGLRELFGTHTEMTLPLSATGSAGMEACLVNLLEPGDAIVVGVAGVFGTRMCEVATRAGALVTRVDVEPGSILQSSPMAEAIARVRPKAVAFVHAETSTGVLQPVPEIAAAARDAGALVVLDCVTSLAGVPVQLDEWGIDAAYSGTQKCLSCPPGLSPVSFSARALESISNRSVPVQSWYLDVTLLAGYFGGGSGGDSDRERVYHHTAPISAILGLAEGLRIVAREGMEARAKRHREVAASLVASLGELGFEPLVDARYRLPPLTSVLLPPRVLQWSSQTSSDGTGEAGLRRRLLDQHGIEVGAGLGSLAGRIWRIGLMGENATSENVERLLSALREELA
jgi:alanine-glyoxylate transaminase/serine-glyoxylate transaminase/serine-pyruvate transaminase